MAAATTHETFSAYRGELERQGYRNTPPQTTYMAAGGEAIDRDICAEVTCHICGHAGMSYERYTRGTLSYRAFAGCPQCDAYQEF